jgi:hypothetical protein
MLVQEQRDEVPGMPKTWVAGTSPAMTMWGGFGPIAAQALLRELK